MAVIDSDNLITHLVWSGIVDKATCGELKKAIELCTIKDVYTKNEVVDILLDIKMRYKMTFDEAIKTTKGSKWITSNDYNELVAFEDTIKNIEQFEVIPKADYDARLKSDMVAMLEEIKNQINDYMDRKWEILTDADKTGCATIDDQKYHIAEVVDDYIQQKIDKLKEEENGIYEGEG